MFIASKRNIVLPSADGTRQHFVPRDFVGEIPDWAAETAYFRALTAAGKIAVPESRADRDVESASEVAEGASETVESALIPQRVLPEDVGVQKKRGRRKTDSE